MGKEITAKEIEQIISAYKWMPWELYLLITGERSTDYSYTPEMIYEHIEYFRECWKNNLSCYKSLEFFSFELDDKI